MALHTGARVERVATRGEAVVIGIDDGTELAADRLLVATGRTVDLSGLGLEAAGLDDSSGFIAVDDRLQAEEGIWAIGDVTGKGNFTHVALYQSSIVAADILGESPPPADYAALPRVTFTDPEVGAVGVGRRSGPMPGVSRTFSIRPGIEASSRDRVGRLGVADRPHHSR